MQVWVGFVISLDLPANESYMTELWGYRGSKGRKKDQIVGTEFVLLRDRRFYIVS